MGGDGDELSFTTTCLLKPQPRQASVGGVTKSRPLEICQVTTGEAKGVHGGICDRAGEARARIGEDDGRLGRARDGIERFMLCFLSKFSQQTADSQGYSVTTRLPPKPTRLVPALVPTYRVHPACALHRAER